MACPVRSAQLEEMKITVEKPMKTKMGVCLALVLCATAAFAEWKMDFPEQYRKEGIDKAVIAAIEQGALPVDIVENGLQLEGLNPQNLVKALYCAGANGKDIIAAAQQHEISEIILAAGYKKAIEECGDQIADSQAYTPIAMGFTGAPDLPPDNSSASPDGTER
jgi:hypothetical protein